MSRSLRIGDFVFCTQCCEWKPLADMHSVWGVKLQKRYFSPPCHECQAKNQKASRRGPYYRIIPELVHAQAWLSRKVQTPLQAALISDRASVISLALSTLTEREEKVLRLRFGIGDNYPRTLREVATVYDVTHERIRQIEAKALRKMRHPTRRELLEEVMPCP